MLLTMATKCILWNVRGWNNKRAEIFKRVQDFDMVFLTEIKNKKKDVFNISGYNCICKNNFRQGEGEAGSVAIFFRKNISVKIIKRDKDKKGFDSVELELELLNKRFINIVLIYRRSGRTEKKGTWKEIVKDVDKKNGRIIVGDFNAHNTVWNCEDVDRMGKDYWRNLRRRIFLSSTTTLSLGWDS